MGREDTNICEDWETFEMGQETVDIYSKHWTLEHYLPSLHFRRAAIKGALSDHGIRSAVIHYQDTRLQLQKVLCMGSTLRSACCWAVAVPVGILSAHMQHRAPIDMFKLSVLLWYFSPCCFPTLSAGVFPQVKTGGMH